RRRAQGPFESCRPGAPGVGPSVALAPECFDYTDDEYDQANGGPCDVESQDREIDSRARLSRSGEGWIKGPAASRTGHTRFAFQEDRHAEKYKTRQKKPE